MAPQIPSRWHLKGTVTLACNCDYGCPCNFNARPTQGHCEGEWTWHVAEGRYADTPLDGLHFTSCLLRAPSQEDLGPAAVQVRSGATLLKLSRHGSRVIMRVSRAHGGVHA